MKWLCSLVLAVVLLLGTETAHAAEDDLPVDVSKPLIYTGAALWSAGYVPVVAASAPTIAGSLYRGFVTVLTLGVLVIACDYASSDLDDEDQRKDYTCNGKAGALELAIPFAGPFLYAHNHLNDTFINIDGHPVSGSERTLLYASGTAQITGALLLAAGLIAGQTQHPMQSADAPKMEGPRFTVLPMVTSSSIGVSASLVNW